jgi:hypothetical protein
VKAEGTGAHTRRQKAEGKKDFRRKGGYQGGFGIKQSLETFAQRQKREDGNSRHLPSFPVDECSS